MNELRGLALPGLIDDESHLRTIEISVVQPPCRLDFGKVYLDREPPYWRDEQIMGDDEARRREMFEDRWPEVQRILADLRTMDIYYVDPTPANIMFGDE